jgi:hypothetical protein
LKVALEVGCCPGIFLPQSFCQLLHGHSELDIAVGRQMLAKKLGQKDKKAGTGSIIENCRFTTCLASQAVIPEQVTQPIYTKKTLISSD